MGLTGTTHSNYSGTMCRYIVNSGDFLCPLPLGISCHLPRCDTQYGENLMNIYTSPYHTSLTYSTAASSLPTARQPILTSRLKVRRIRSIYSTQPSRVINYSFDLLGLFLDPTRLENPKNRQVYPDYDSSPYGTSIAIVTSYSCML